MYEAATASDRAAAAAAASTLAKAALFSHRALLAPSKTPHMHRHACLLCVPHGRVLRIAAVQAAALVPAAQRPFVPYRARTFCTQQQRQQVASKLFGAALVLLLQELQVPPQQQQQVRRKVLVYDCSHSDKQGPTGQLAQLASAAVVPITEHRPSVCVCICLPHLIARPPARFKPCSHAICCSKHPWNATAGCFRPP